MIMRLGCSFLWCTISVYNKKPASIYDAWEGPYFAPMNWNIQSGKEHEWTWLSSPDMQRKKEAAYLAEYGNLDQAYSYHSPITYPSVIVAQRPAL